MIEPAKTIAAYNPLSFIVEGIRDPIISGISASDDSATRCSRSPAIALLGALPQRRAPCATG